MRGVSKERELNLKMRNRNLGRPGVSGWASRRRYLRSRRRSPNIRDIGEIEDDGWDELRLIFTIRIALLLSNQTKV